MWMVPLLALALARADCPDDPVEGVRDAAAAVEVAFAGIDEAAFERARDRLAEVLPCVDAPLTRADAVVVHRAMGLVLFFDGDMRGSRKSWAAVKALDPEWALPEVVAPEGHLVRTFWDQADPTDARIELDLAPEGGWIVDGEATSWVPSERAFVLQAVGAEGAIQYTGHELTVAGVPLVDLVQPGKVSPRAKKVRKHGTIIGASMAVAAGGALALHLQARSSLDDVPYTRVRGTAAAGNVAGTSAIVLAAGSAGVLGVAWAVPW